MRTRKKHPESGETLFLERRQDAGLDESAYVWRSLDGRTLIDPTDEEDREAVNYYNGGSSITDN